MKKIVFVLAMAAVLAGCSKETNTGTAKLTFKLTDAPAAYDKLNIDIQGISVIVNDTVINLNVEPAVINLLDLVNGKDTIIADQQIPAGKLSQIRLILGSNNTIVTGSSTFALSTPSAQQSGLKLNVQKDLTGGVAYAYTIDFDAARSVVKTGNDTYILKPVLRVITDAVSGAIKGVVSPAKSKPALYAISSKLDTITTFADTISGQYFFKGVPAGTYKLNLVPVSPYTEKTLTDIIVSNGLVTAVDTVKFE